MSRMVKGIEYLDKEMKALAGGRIVFAGGMELTDSEGTSLFDEATPTMKVMCLDGKTRTVCFLQDPEGNGPGHPAIEED